MALSFGLGLPPAPKKGGLFPRAYAAWDFTRNRGRIGGVSGIPSALPGYTFTRASTGYAEDTYGNLISFASGVPRITNKGVLIEEARTNLLLQSQALSTSPWVAVSGTVTANAGVAPDGSNTANNLATATYYQPNVIPSGTSVYSMYAKANGGSQITLKADVSGNGRQVVFDLSAGTAGASTPLGGGGTVASMTGSITGPVNGWYRCIVVVVTSGINNPSYITVGNVLGWGASVEAGSFPTSYIPTTSSTATRAADVFSYAHTVAAVGTVGATATPSPTVGSPRIIGSNSGAVTYLYQTSAAANNYGTYNGATTLIKSWATAVGTVSAAVSWDGTNRSVTYNGLTPATSASAISNGSVTAINIGSDNGTSNFWNNYIQRLAIYPFAASDAQLQTISSGQF